MEAKKPKPVIRDLPADKVLSSKLSKALKRKGLTADNVEWFANAIETGAIKIPEIQKQYVKIKDELEAIDYKKTIAKYQLDDMNNQITYLNRISYSKRNEIVSLQIAARLPLHW